MLASGGEKINLISSMVLLGFFAATLQSYVMGMYLGMSYPFNTFLFLPSVHQTDFTGLINGCSGLNPYLQDNFSAQLPFCNYTAYLFSLFPLRISFLAYLIISFGPVAALLYSEIRRFNDQPLINTFIIVFLSYPVLFAADRGNFEGIVFSLSLLYFYFLYTEDRPAIAAILIAFAIALKGYPVIFVGVLILKRKYFYAFVALALGLLLSLGSLAIFSGGFTENLLFISGGANFQHPAVNVFVTQPDLVQRGISLFTLSKVFIHLFGLSPLIDYNSLLALYKVLSIGLLAVFCFLAWRVRISAWRTSCLLCSAAMLLPHLSAHYKLLLVFIPLYFYIRDQVAQPSGRLVAVIYGLLLIPKPYLRITSLQSDAPGPDITCAVLLDPILLLMLVYLCCRGDRNPQYA